MSQSSFSDLARLFANCLGEKKQWPAALAEALAERLQVEAESVQSGSLIAETDPERAGYLRARVADRNIFVPFTLADGLPAATVLQKIVSITEEMKFSPDSSICLSGSATFLGSLSSIVDLDASEYNFEPPVVWCERLEALAARRSSVAILVWTRVAGKRARFPFKGAICAIRERSGNRKFHDESDQIFLEFLTVGTSQSPLAASNKVFGVARGAANEGAGRKSHVFQELVISAGDPPPRTLVVPGELGNYVNFLRKEAEKQLKAGLPLKAAKRLLALARIINAKPVGDALVALLNKYADVTEGEARKKATNLLKILPKDRRELLQLPLAATPKATAADLPSGVRDAIQEISNRLGAGFHAISTASRK